MRATGIIRRVDELGRIVIPKEIRSNLHIHEGDSMELWIDDNTIYFKKYDNREHLALDTKDLMEDIKSAILDEYRSSENREAMTEAAKLIQQAYEKLRYAERIE